MFNESLKVMLDCKACQKRKSIFQSALNPGGQVTQITREYHLVADDCKIQVCSISTFFSEWEIVFKHLSSKIYNGNHFIWYLDFHEISYNVPRKSII